MKEVKHNVVLIVLMLIACIGDTMISSDFKQSDSYLSSVGSFGSFANSSIIGQSINLENVSGNKFDIYDESTVLNDLEKINSGFTTLSTNPNKFIDLKDALNNSEKNLVSSNGISLNKATIPHLSSYSFTN